jgi:peptide/nickel transport system substrate-binding protein
MTTVIDCLLSIEGEHMSIGTKSWLGSYAGRQLSRRRLLKGTAAGAGAALLAACAGGTQDSGLKLDDAGISRAPGSIWQTKNDWKLADETKQAVRGGIYRDVRDVDVVSHWDPIPQEAANAAYGGDAYEFLMARNRGPGIEPGSEAYGTPIPGLAESWEISGDGLSVVFTLRPNVKFHNIPPVNGRVMDVDDWKTSHERQQQVGSYRTQLGEALAGIEFPDRTHMVWKLKSPLSPLFDRIFDNTFAYWIMPKELNADPSIAEKQVISTGPRMLDKFQPSLQVEWRKHPQYWGGEPFIDRWHEPIITEYSNRYAQFVNGGITDFIPAAREILQLHRDAPNAVIVAKRINDNSACRVRFGRISPEKQAWNDPRVRIAIRRSINYRGIGEVLSNKAELERNGIPVEITPMTHLMQNPAYWLDPEKGELGEYSKNFIYDTAEAKKLTAAAGSSGPIHLPYYISGQGQLTDAEQLVTDSLKQSGVWDLEIRQVTLAEYRVNINIDGRFDGVQNQSCAAGISNDYVMYRDYHSRGRAPDRQAFPDPKIDQLIEAQRKELDFNKRSAIWKDIQLYWATVFPTVPGRHLYTEFEFRWPWLHNSNYAVDRTANPDLGLHLHWLDKDMPNRDRSV